MARHRTFIHHEVGKALNPDGTTSIFCRKCGREIMRAVHPTIRTVTQCAICRLKEEGVLDPEDHVLAQYKLPDPSSPPVPIDIDDDLSAGVLLLYPETKLAEDGRVPFSGGVIGTVRSIFRALGFLQPEEKEPTPSKTIATNKRRKGLYD